jgi:hypothetical protein
MLIVLITRRKARHSLFGGVVEALFFGKKGGKTKNSSLGYNTDKGFTIENPY